MFDFARRPRYFWLGNFTMETGGDIQVKAEGKWTGGGFFHKDYASINMTCHDDQPPPPTWVDDPPAGWKGSKGFITEAMIAEHLPAAGAETVTLLCGPPGMIKFACKVMSCNGHGHGADANTPP